MDETPPTPPQSVYSLPPGDINTAAALRAQYAIVTPKAPRRRPRKLAQKEEPEVLVDQTATLPLHSRKTERQQRRQQKKSEKLATQPATISLLDLPSEILFDIFTLILPSDLFRLLRTSHSLRDLVLEHEHVIARSIIQRRYWILYRCFPLPIASKDIPADIHHALLGEKRLRMLNLHRKSYSQHIQTIDPQAICTCLTCIFAWNNLCLVVDLHHWQYNLEHREPIPMIKRGSTPQWNLDLLQRNAEIVQHAMIRPLMYTAILEKHLATITDTILRSSRWKKKDASGNKPRLYHMTDKDRSDGTDMFLERAGPPCYDFPFHRDTYYMLEAYLPNRKWSSETKRWHYYALPPFQHERDLDWVRQTMNQPVTAIKQPATEPARNTNPLPDGRRASLKP